MGRCAGRLTAWRPSVREFATGSTMVGKPRLQVGPPGKLVLEKPSTTPDLQLAELLERWPMRPLFATLLAKPLARPGRRVKLLAELANLLLVEAGGGPPAR